MFNNFYGIPFGGPMHPMFLNSNHHYDHCDHHAHHAHPFGPVNTFGPRHSFGPCHSFGQAAPFKCFPNGHFDHFLNSMNMRPSPMHNVGGPFGHHENFKSHGHHGHHDDHKHHDHSHHKHHKHESNDHKCHNHERRDYVHHGFTGFPVNQMNQVCRPHLRAPAHFMGNRFAHPLGFPFCHSAVRRFAYPHLLPHYRFLRMKHYLGHHHHLEMKHHHLPLHHLLGMKHHYLRHHHLLGMKHHHLRHRRLLRMRYHLINSHLNYGEHFDHPLEMRNPFVKRRCHSLGSEPRFMHAFPLFGRHCRSLDRKHHFGHHHSLEYMKYFKHFPLMYPLPHFGRRCHSLDRMHHFGRNHHSSDRMNRFNRLPLMFPPPPFGRRCHSLGPEHRFTDNQKLFGKHRSHSLDRPHHNLCSRRARSLEMVNLFIFSNVHHCGHRGRHGRSLSPKPIINHFMYEHLHHKHHNHKHHKHDRKKHCHCKKFNKCDHHNVDIMEDENNYYIYTNLYGINKENIKINYNKNNVLTISDKQKQKSENEDDNEINESNESYKNEKRCLNEKKCGKFKRKIDIPGEIDPKSIKVKYWNRILEITINKSAKTDEIPAE